MFNQPLVIGYIIAGVIISPYIISFGASNEIIDIFSHFGIAFLLFMVGLHMNPKIIKEIGSTSLFVGVVQMTLTFALGFFTALFLGFDNITSSFVGIALAFSSTIIIMKLLSDKKQIDSLYGKISIGILIIQDIVAIGVLMFISSFSSGDSFSSLAVRGFFAGGGLIVILFLMGVFVLPKLTRSIAKSQELLFLFSITWAFVVAALFSYIGFSIEIGALVAGVVLSISPYSIDISSKIRPLRDFFLIIFFIIIGLNIPLGNISSIAFNAIIFSIIALIFKPLILMSATTIFGYTKRTNFLVGTTLGQISEFSLIVLTLAAGVGLIQGEILSTITLTAVITITLSTYMIIYSNQIYKRLEKPISLFERKKLNNVISQPKKKYDAVLFGYNKIGFTLLKELKKMKKKYVVVDFNPDTISALSKFDVPCIYGDAYDSDFLEELDLENVKIIASTIPDFETNFVLVDAVRQVNPKAIIIVRASDVESAFELYKRGATYVLTPYLLGGQYLARMIGDFETDKISYKKEKEKHMKMLKDIEDRKRKFE